MIRITGLSDVLADLERQPGIWRHLGTDSRRAAVGLRNALVDVEGERFEFECRSHGEKCAVYGRARG